MPYRARFLIYLKVFLGMGLIWTFEILAGLTDVGDEVWYRLPIIYALNP